MRFHKRRRFTRRRSTRRFKASIEKALSPMCVYKSINGGVIAGVQDRKLYYTSELFSLGDYEFLRALEGLSIKETRLKQDGTGTGTTQSLQQATDMPFDGPIDLKSITNFVTIKNRSAFPANVTVYFFKVTNNIEDLDGSNDPSQTIMTILQNRISAGIQNYGVPLDPLGNNGVWSASGWGQNTYDENTSTGTLQSSLVSGITAQNMNYDYRVIGGATNTYLHETFFDTHEMLNLKDAANTKMWFKCYGSKKVHVPPGDSFTVKQKIKGFKFSLLDDYIMAYKGQSSKLAGFVETWTKMNGGAVSHGLIYRKGRGKFMVVKVESGAIFAAKSSLVTGVDSVGYPAANLEYVVKRVAFWRKGLKSNVPLLYVDPPSWGSSSLAYSTGTAFQEGETTGNPGTGNVFTTLGQ